MEGLSPDKGQPLRKLLQVGRQEGGLAGGGRGIQAAWLLNTVKGSLAGTHHIDTCKTKSPMELHCLRRQACSRGERAPADSLNPQIILGPGKPLSWIVPDCP